jgi:hypothetical protein
VKSKIEDIGLNREGDEVGYGTLHDESMDFDSSTYNLN